MNPSPHFCAPVSFDQFKSLTQTALAARQKAEHWTFSLIGEMTQFLRFNHSRVRQTGIVEDAELSIQLVLETTEGLKSAEAALTLQGSFDSMQSEVFAEMMRLREEVKTLPVDPFATIPTSHEKSESVRQAELLDPTQAAPTLIQEMGNADLAGIYASGTQIRATATSTGALHWFESPSFSFDYSLYTPAQKALKSLYAGQKWSTPTYAAQLHTQRQHLKALERKPRQVPKGTYRVYLAPQALAEIIGMLAYGTLSEAAIRQNKSPLRLMRAGEKSLSPLFSLTEDFTQGDVPRFNDEGILSAPVLPLIQNGQLIQTLISSRTAAEYQLQGNGAAESESLRSPSISAGKLKETEILNRLGTGLFLSNLHYLNWSDSFKGRLTGMTRYACFWVENGEIQAPINDLRFDDSLFTLLGSELEDLTETVSTIAETGTYNHRYLGSMKVPGALIRNFEFTL